MISPYNVPFLLWAHNLTNDFPDDIIPIITDEKDWRNWGNIVAGEKSFARVGAPRTDFFDSPVAWASRLYSMLG